MVSLSEWTFKEWVIKTSMDLPIPMIQQHHTLGKVNGMQVFTIIKETASFVK